jgi:hypothetical protein
MAETGQKKITLSNFFEQIVEINKVSQEALKKSNESVSISEKTKLDLEKLIATLKITFDRDLQNVEAQSSRQVTNILNRNDNRQITNVIQENAAQRDQISSLIREDAVEDTELRNAFSSLQSSFSTLQSALSVLRNDLNSLSNAFLQMQQGRSKMLKSQELELSKEEDTLQKEQFLGTQPKQQTRQLQDQKRQQEQRENKALSALKGLIGGGLLAGAGAGLFPSPELPTGQVFEDVTADTPEERSLLKTIRAAEGTGGKGGYGKIFGGAVVPELEQGKLTIEEAARMSETGKLPDRLGGRAVPYGTYKGRVSGATGAYQFMPGTLRGAAASAGISLDTPLTPAIQDKLGLSNIRRTGVDPTKPATRETLNQLQGQWTGLGRSQGGMGIDYNTQRYNTILKQEKEKQIQIDKATQTLMNLDKLTKPQQIPGTQPAIPQNPSTLQPQSYILPEQRKGIPELTKPVSQDIASITLPPIDAGTQQVGGQGRGQAATQSYTVSSASNSMTFAKVLTSNFSDKMNIAVG